MKTNLFPLLLAFFLFRSLNLTYAQDEPSDFTGRDLRQRETAAQTDRFNFVPNEIILRFKDEVQLKSGSQLKSTGISGIDRVLQTARIENVEPLFPKAERLKSSHIVKTPLGQDMEVPSLHNIYKITLPVLKSNQPQEAYIHEYIQELLQQPEVEYAEPNFIYTIGDFEPAGPAMTMLEAMEQPTNYNISQTASGLIPNDPLYNSQWGIPACNIDDVWNTTKGDSTSIIAIMDTGVDKDHPDLQKNIWKNDAEIPGNGQDDDGNGKVDDTWGWDFINNDNEPYDDNSHGTHCAGIAAAVGDNGIGIAGVNWKARILPVKVFQSSGQGDAATIAQGITYAAEKGANVISMSFGSYAKSLAMQDALANAYATSVLVAAAGNDSKCIGPGSGCAPMYPAAFSFVLGVEANSSAARAGFSNYDQDGPVFSNYSDLLNYELKAPGAGILSSIPGGNYREYSGTSMATPLVAGAVSLYREQKPEESQELLFGNLIHSINQHIDLQEALNSVPEPVLDIVSYELIDTIDGDGDGRADAGETIELKVTVRNTWGQATDVMVGIDFAEFEDQSVAEIQLDTATIGSVSAYAKRFNEIPLKIIIGEEVADGRDIVFDLRTWYGDCLGEKIKTIKISVENGIELKGVLNEDLTLYPNKHYIITDNLAVAEGVTLTIKPGTTLKFAESKMLVAAGTVVALGKPDSLITFTKRDLSNSWQGIKVASTGILTFNYGIVSYGGKFDGYDNNNLIVVDGYSTKVLISNVYFKDNFGWNMLYNLKYSKFYNNVFTRNQPGRAVFFSLYRAKLENNVISNNYTASGAISDHFSYPDSIVSNSIWNNFIQEDREMNIEVYEDNFSIIQIPPNYFGTANDIKIKDAIYDFEDNGDKALLDISNRLLIPPIDNHGFVWKILVNSIDAQDEFDLLDPVGVGRQKIEVYFNRAMDTTITPQVSMGVRYPYTQTSIAEDGSWSTDSTIYTVYLNVGLTTGDGINTIRVSGAQDPDHFEIPIEDRRFRVIVNGAGSLSSGFMATAGMGLVDLEWENPMEGVEDLLGYNMYRYTFVNDSVTSDTLQINSSLLTDTLYTDFSVTPDIKYYYCYKTVRTNLSESDFSKVVAATPYTAAKGDANGDLSVNVSDIVTVVNYILENNPQPFIHEAGDVNSDEAINVLDIVALVNIILNPEGGAKTGVFGNAQISIEDGIVYVDSPVELGGIQFTLADVTSEQEVEILEALEGFEVVRKFEDGKLTILAYSLSGNTISEGKTALLKLNETNSWIFEAILSNTSGQSIDWELKGDVTAIETMKLNAGFSLGQNYPNPFTGTTTIPFKLEMDVEEVSLSVYDIMGRMLKQWQFDGVNKGSHHVEWQSGNNPGVYVYKMQIKEKGNISNAKTKRMIIQ
ncbi:S8 family serine peptidase [Draconibacterium sp. IB214405]|uniref:S8 family serine peptidase n=1 Tax=Draconibacterium sp. IB214405 TaxID=3097352 RepID=UPI002A1708AC|nr:S8 family serine peptidase [Draconibacterium sp. IB214405]MDX8339273.1 S8 family serine peptidase [Draconibacterium sp. IB214405]